jgi:hypothetical protein
MCLLIYKNANITIAEDHLETAFNANPHGAGFVVRMVNEDGTSYLHRERGFFKYSDFIEAYRPFAMEQGIVHFRLATAGLKNEANCHPFEVSSAVHMAHNGIIPIAQSISKEHSDTWHYVEQVIKPIADRDPESLWNCNAIQFLFAQSIGGSKLAFLHEDGRYLLINEEAGHWDDEKSPSIWYSNDSYEKVCYGYGFNRPLLADNKEWSFTGWSTSTSLATEYGKKDIRRLERAREKLGVDGEWLVDDAVKIGMLPEEILAYSNSFDDLYEAIFCHDNYEYRTHGSSIPL